MCSCEMTSNMIATDISLVTNIFIKCGCSTNCGYEQGALVCCPLAHEQGTLVCCPLAHEQGTLVCCPLAHEQGTLVCCLLAHD